MRRPLPPIVHFTGAFADDAEFHTRLAAVLARGPRLVVMRAKGCRDTAHQQALAAAVMPLVRAHASLLLLGAEGDAVAAAGADGRYLGSQEVTSTGTLSTPPGTLLAISCHSAEELGRAAALGADLLFLSPVQATATHADSLPLGWEGLRALAALVELPVYALGGIKEGDLATAHAAGAAGIALSKPW